MFQRMKDKLVQIMNENDNEPNGKNIKVLIILKSVQ